MKDTSTVLHNVDRVIGNPCCICRSAPSAPAAATVVVAAPAADSLDFDADGDSVYSPCSPTEWTRVLLKGCVGNEEQLSDAISL